jgi:hypothetical protein
LGTKLGTKPRETGRNQCDCLQRVGHLIGTDLRF